MNWIKQSKFEAILLIVVVAVAAGIIFFGLSQGKAYAEAKERFDDAESEVERMERGEPYPNPDNVEDREAAVADFREEVAELQERLLNFRPETLEDISPAEFNTRLTEASEKLRKMFEDRGIVFPEQWQAGFESYTSSPPKDAATPYLNYQLQALEALYTDLAKAGPSELVNVYRGKLPIEEGESMDGEEETRRGRGRRQTEEKKPYHVMPVELTFRGDEQAVRMFLSELAGAEDYFTSVRSIRVRNSQTAAPKISDAEFEGGLDTGEDEPADPFGDFDNFFDTETEGESDEASEEVEKDDPGSDQILGQVLGAEELNVFLQLELLLFKKDVELPEVGS